MKHFSQPDGSVCVPFPSNCAPASQNITLHVSFDFAQQVNISVMPMSQVITLLSKGALPQQPPSARTHLLSYTKKVWHLRRLSRRDTTTSKLQVNRSL